MKLVDKPLFHGLFFPAQKGGGNDFNRRSDSGCLSAADTFVSGEEIAGRLGITRAGVWKHIDALRRAGFEISSSTNRGYRLTGIPDTPSPEVLSAMLNTAFMGRTIEYHPVISSTNERP